MEIFLENEYAYHIESEVELKKRHQIFFNCRKNFDEYSLNIFLIQNIYNFH